MAERQESKKRLPAYRWRRQKMNKYKAGVA
jgi:hypothetical protein